MTSPPAAKLRRNGTQQSCERCRKTKIKCDHSIPKCSRCVAKNLDCVYEAAPMTRRFRAARFDVRSGRVRTTAKTQDAADTQQSSPISERWPEPPTPISSGQAIEITTPPVQTGVFVGPGSYRTLTADDGHTLRYSSSYCGSTASPGTVIHTMIEREKLELGLRVLEFVKEYSVLLRHLMRHIYRVIRMPIIPPKIMLPAVESLCDSIVDDFPANDDEAKLRTVVRIFQCSYQSVQGSEMTTVEQLCQAVTSDNLRWETIGNILVMASLCLVHIHSRDFALLDPDKRSKEDLIPPFHKITDTLTTLTSALPGVNELVVCLKYNQLLLALHRFGDSSQHLYSIFMELTSSIYATGMHQDNPTGGAGPAEYPRFMHQWRRRCFTAVYSMDKTISTLLYRPPLIHRHYCVLDPPLDLDDDDLTGVELEHELQKLDQHGWNTDGRRRSTTFMRLRFLLATVREEALELHLGVDRNAWSPGKAQLLLQKLQSLWNSAPENMKYSSALWSGPLSSHDIWFLLSLYMDYIYSIFLIFRFNARQDQSPESLELLLSAAKDVLSTVLIFNEQRERLREVRSDFSAIFLPYGLPCADVLAVELMYRPSTFTMSPGPGPGGRPRLIRAEVIRELTIYVSCLSWVPRQGSNNAEFSKDVQDRFTHILDQIIDAPVATNDPLTNIQDSDLRGEGLGRDFLDISAVNLNHLSFGWDMGMPWDSQPDLFSQSLL